MCLAVTALYVVPEVGRFIDGSQIEFGDFANNGLRIRDAIRLHEIYGNYSRYGFYHPGPAFWYLYAVGELVFHRWTGLISSAGFAHILIGTIFQVACAMAAICYLSYRTQWFLAPFLLVILLFHWHYMLGAPSSIWPPHVLFGPFLLLLVFGAAVAAGDGRCIPVLAFAGGMLVHGHVAQPLQVLPIVLCSGVGYLCNTTSAARKRDHIYLLASAGIVILFLIPIIVDLTLGSKSNCAVILAHLRSSSANRHTFSRGISYFLSFFRYETDQHIFLSSTTFSTLTYLRRHWASWVIAVLSLCCGQILLFRRSLRYSRWFVAFINLSIALSIFWSAFQDGPMFDFNGNYFYAVIYLILVYLWYLLPQCSANALVTKVLPSDL